MKNSPSSWGAGDTLAARAVVFEQPESVRIRELELAPPGAAQALVAVEWSGISTGTEKLLFSGAMPPFPGMGYPLVPGYETVGTVVAVGPEAGVAVGERVFVSGASCYGEIRGLFGGASSRVVVDADKLVPVGDRFAEEAVLLALAATGHHAVTLGGGDLPDLVIGHGVLGRLVARLCLALGGERPRVWETNATRRSGEFAYDVVDPDADSRRDYRRIIDVSGDAAIIDRVVDHLAPRGEIVLAGFYAEPVAFAFPKAFMKEAVIRISAEWQKHDLEAVSALAAAGDLSFDGLITHRSHAADAPAAYARAFNDPACLKMVLDWRS